jgi:hypothetical protein
MVDESRRGYRASGDRRGEPRRGGNEVRVENKGSVCGECPRRTHSSLRMHSPHSPPQSPCPACGNHLAPPKEMRDVRLRTKARPLQDRGRYQLLPFLAILGPFHPIPLVPLPTPISSHATMSHAPTAPRVACSIPSNVAPPRLRPASTTGDEAKVEVTRDQPPNRPTLAQARRAAHMPTSAPSSPQLSSQLLYFFTTSTVSEASSSTPRPHPHYPGGTLGHVDVSTQDGAARPQAVSPLV